MRNWQAYMLHIPSISFKIWYLKFFHGFDFKGTLILSIIFRCCFETMTYVRKIQDDNSSASSQIMNEGNLYSQYVYIMTVFTYFNIFLFFWILDILMRYKRLFMKCTTHYYSKENHKRNYQNSYDFDTPT